MDISQKYWMHLYREALLSSGLNTMRKPLLIWHIRLVKNLWQFPCLTFHHAGITGMGHRASLNHLVTFMTGESKVRDNFACSLITKRLCVFNWMPASVEHRKALSWVRGKHAEITTLSFHWIINTVTRYENFKIDCKLIPACKKLSDSFFFLSLHF